MSDGSGNGNASPAQVTPGGLTASSNELHDIHKKLLRDIWVTWGQHRDGSKDQVKFTRLSVVTCSQVAATCAVDVHMTEEQFLATCKANYEQASKNAPKWG